MATKQSLIEEGERLLGKVYEKDVFGIGSPVAVLPNDEMAHMHEWVENLNIFVLTQAEAVREEVQNLWLVNGERVAPERMLYAIKILKSLPQ